MRRTDYEKHGHCSNGKYTPEYKIWQHMLERCYDKSDKRYKDYGGRGIRVYKGWIKSFKSFFKYVGLKPDKNYTLDRIENDGDYEPGNVRWATAHAQSLNRRLQNNNKSGHSGIFFNESIRKYEVSITINRAKKNLGYYADLDKAIKIRKTAEIEYYKPIIDSETIEIRQND